MGLLDLFFKKSPQPATQSVSTGYMPVRRDDRTFDEKLQEIARKSGLSLQQRIMPEQLETEAGCTIFTRLKTAQRPNEISYGLYRDGQRVLMIRLWDSYDLYNHVANRQIKTYCDRNHIAMLDFFDYMPNDADYMEQRIQKAITLR